MTEDELFANLPAALRMQAYQGPQVATPDYGAAAYWYVDPRAQGTPGPPVQGPPAFSEPTPIPASQAGYSQRYDPAAERTDYTRPGPSIEARRERADLYDRMRYHGMTEPPNVDHEVAESTGIVEMDGVYYILPTRIDGTDLTRREIRRRFRTTGEHLGAFETLPDAKFFETNYITPQQQAPPPQSSSRPATGKVPLYASVNDENDWNLVQDPYAPRVLRGGQELTRDDEEYMQELEDAVQMRGGRALPLPYRALPGPQFDPQDVPIPWDPTHGFYFDPNASRGLIS
jgi:hypothetical protein